MGVTIIGVASESGRHRLPWTPVAKLQGCEHMQASVSVLCQLCGVCSPVHMALVLWRAEVRRQMLGLYVFPHSSVCLPPAQKSGDLGGREPFVFLSALHTFLLKNYYNFYSFFENFIHAYNAF